MLIVLHASADFENSVHIICAKKALENSIYGFSNILYKSGK